VLRNTLGNSSPNLRAPTGRKEVQPLPSKRLPYNADEVTANQRKRLMKAVTRFLNAPDIPKTSAVAEALLACTAQNLIVKLPQCISLPYTSNLISMLRISIFLKQNYLYKNSGLSNT
jgi:hypothetical protein